MVGQINAFLIITFGLSRTLSENVPEFQYPCYVDVCTFPTQFCNSDKYERRCSPCSRAICRQRNVPTACRYICMKHSEYSTTVKSSTTSLAPSRHESAAQGNDNLASLHLIMSYSAISTTLLVVVLLAFVAYYIHRKRVAEERTKTNSQSVRYISDTNSCVEERLLKDMSTDNRGICRYCGHTPRPEMLNLHVTENSLPSYATCDPGKPLFSRSDTPSSPGSIESVQVPARTVLVKPMTTKPPAKVDNNLATENDSIWHQSVSDTGMQTRFSGSSSNSDETGSNDETGLKISNI